MLAGGMGGDDGLDLIPKLTGDDGLAIFFDDEIAKFERADVDGIVEEGCVTVEAVVEVDGTMDLYDGFAFGFHSEGGEDAMFVMGIWLPAVGCAFDARFTFDGDGDAANALGRRARDCALFDEVAQAAPGSH